MSAPEVPRIHRLSGQLINQIAAGEVVERPASVVRELLDNALDAAASEVRIAILGAGCELIQVRDNGQGIHPEDLSLAVDRNATSKLNTMQDLEHIASLGFRGEALASIASVSQFQIISCPRDSKHGWCLEPQSGRPPRPVAHPPGTTVEVRNLFHNTPARRKFLKSPRTEWLHIQQLVRGVAVGHCTIRFQLLNEGRQVLHCPPADPQGRVENVLGSSFLRQALAIDASHEGMELSGWVGRPESARSQTDQQFFYVNGRLVRARLVVHAVHQAFAGRLASGRHAVYLLHLDLDPGLVDVNVHPNKQEVKFRRQREVYALLFGALGERLAEDQRLPGLVLDEPVQQEPVPAPPPQGPLQINEAVRIESLHDLLQPLEDQKSDPGKAGQWLALPDGRFALWLRAADVQLFDVPRAWQCLLEQELSRQWQSGQGATRSLSVPLALAISAAEVRRLEAHQELLQQLGVVLRLTSPSQVTLDAFPECLARVDLAQLIRDCLDWLRDCRGVPEQHHQSALCRQLACRVSASNTTEELRLLARLWHSHQEQVPAPRPWRLLQEQDWSALLRSSQG